MGTSEFKEYLRLHRPTSWSNLTKDNQKIIIEDLNRIVENYKPTEIYLCGSYATGMELNLYTPEPISFFMTNVLGKKISDRDYHIVPGTKTMITKDGYQILPFLPKQNFLIWTAPCGIMP